MTAWVMRPRPPCAIAHQAGTTHDVAFARNELPQIQFSNSQNNFKHTFTISLREAPEPCIYLSPQGGRGECRVPAAPAASCALGSGRTHTSNKEYTGTPCIPARNGFNSRVRVWRSER